MPALHCLNLIISLLIGDFKALNFFLKTKELREATYTAAVCKFGGGGHFFVFLFGSECGTAQLSLSLFPIVIDVDGLDNILPSWSSSTSTSMTMIFLTNQRPRNYLKQKIDDTQHRINLLVGPALGAVACKKKKA